MKKLLALLLLLATPVYADVDNPLLFSQEDGSAIVVPYQVKVDHTDNADGTITISAGGGLAVGDAITSGTANRVLYEDATNKLAESADFIFTGVTSSLAMTGTTTATAKSSTVTPVVIKGASSQSVPLTIWRDSADVQLATFTKDSQFITDYSSAGNGFFGKSSGGVKANLAYVTSTNDLVLLDNTLSAFNSWRVGSGTQIDASGAGLMTHTAANIYLNVTNSTGGVGVETSTPKMAFDVTGSTRTTGSLVVGTTVSTVNAGPGTIMSNGQIVNERYINFEVTSTTASPTTVVGQNCSGDTSFIVPVEFNNFKVTSVSAAVSTAASSGTLTLNLRNRTDGVNILSTAATIDVNERSTTTAATPLVIDQSNNTITTDDDVCVQVTVTGTNAYGLKVKAGVRN